MSREDEVRLIAYHMWEEEMHPDGKDAEHWFKAEAIWEQQKNMNYAQRSVGQLYSQREAKRNSARKR